jgi:hypothetical protein
VLSVWHLGRNIKPSFWHALWVTWKISTGKEGEPSSLKGYATEHLMAALGGFSLLIHIEQIPE